MTHRVEPTGREDEWTHQVIRNSDGVIVGWFRTERTAQAFADNGGEAVVEVSIADEPKSVDQLDMFGAAA